MSGRSKPKHPCSADKRPEMACAVLSIAGVFQPQGRGGLRNVFGAQIAVRALDIHPVPYFARGMHTCS